MLYKFRSVNKNTISTLINSEIYFASPSSLNDPYDCRIGIIESLEAAYDSSAVVRHLVDNGGNMLKVLENMDSDIQGVGILSLTEAVSDTQMWTHYGDEHRGICLGFEFPEEWIFDYEGGMIGGSPVVYDGGNPFLPIIHNCYKENYENGKPPPWGKVWPQMMINGLVTKSHDWAPEKEYRVIRKEPGQVKFLPEYLKEVVIGLNASESDTNLINELLAMPKYSHVKKKVVTKDVLNMGIVITEI